MKTDVRGVPLFKYVAIGEPNLNHLCFPFSVPIFDPATGEARQGRQDDQDGSDPPSDPPTALEAVDDSATPSGSGGVTVSSSRRRTRLEVSGGRVQRQVLQSRPFSFRFIWPKKLERFEIFNSFPVFLAQFT